MDSSFIIVIVIGVVITFFILLKVNGIKFFSLFIRKKKEPKAKQEKKDRLNFLPKAILTKPKIFSKKDNKVEKTTESQTASKSMVKSQTPKVLDPNKVQKVSKADFEKYKIEIPKTSNLYSENEKAQLFKNQNVKKPKADDLINFPTFPKPNSDKNLENKPKFNFDDLDFDDYDDDDDDDEDDDFDDLFGDLDFSPPKETVPKLAGKLSESSVPSTNKPFDELLNKNGGLDFPINKSPAQKFSYPNGEILDKRKTQSKYMDVFGTASDVNAYAKEVIVSKILGEPAYQARRRREEERKRRLGFM